MAPDILRLEGVHAYYGQSHVLHGVDLSLKAGGVLGLLGRNGAGKTTCISTIAGLLKPRAGIIMLEGRAIHSEAPERICSLGIGLVPQGRRVFKSLTVQENLAVAQRSRPNGSAVQWSVETVYEMFPRLQERRKQVAGKLSGGEQQMLAIGRALMGNPKVLLLDEPTEGLAPLIVREIAEIVGQLGKGGLSIVLVEQNIAMALAIVDEVVVISNGAVVHVQGAQAFRSEHAVIARHLGVAA